MAREKSRAAFLAASGALLAAGCAGTQGNIASSLLLPSAGAHRRGDAPSLVTPQFVIDYKEAPPVSDYRPAVNFAGTTVIFERIFLPEPNPNNCTGGAPIPCTTEIDLHGNVDIPIAGSPAIFAGFPNVHPTNANLIVIAGQPVAWNLFDGYNQSLNYAYVVDTSAQPYTVTPLDAAAPQQQFDPAYQARAPFYSPDGNWIVFESNRAFSNKLSGYAIFIQDAAGKNPAMRVTDPKWNCQHAKWFANGTQIIRRGVAGAREFSVRYCNARRLRLRRISQVERRRVPKRSHANMV
jgi:WD40-like Beta Propeller Repeat